MKKSIANIWMLLLLVLLSGCTVSGRETEADTLSVYDQYYAARENAGITEARINEVKQQNADKYAFAVMKYELQDLYAEVYLIVMNEYEDIMISTDSVDDLKYAFQCMLMDHPEIFWIDGYSYVRIDEDQSGNLLFSGRYTYDLNEIKVKQVAINDYVSCCMAGLRHDADEYETVKYIYDYVITHTEYVLGAKDNQNILSVFEGGESVCQGYAKATQYLLEYKGISCSFVTGKVSTGEGHGWNLVNIDGAYYYLDTTWGDSSYTAYRGSAKNGMPVNYDYLNVTTEELTKTHIIDSVVSMPLCISDEANYFIREGLYFTGYDEEQLGRAFSKAYDQGDNYIILKASGAQAFQELKDNLLEEKKIFEYIHDGISDVNYVINEDTGSLCFWI